MSISIDLRFNDCLIELNNIEDNSIDLVFADLPFGMTAPKWDKQINITKLWKHYNRILKIMEQSLFSPLSPLQQS